VGLGENQSTLTADERPPVVSAVASKYGSSIGIRRWTGTSVAAGAQAASTGHSAGGVERKKHGSRSKTSRSARTMAAAREGIAA
jgi:hypothetical protein